jgi:hypothetical protein
VSGSPAALTSRAFVLLLTGMLAAGCQPSLWGSQDLSASPSSPAATSALSINEGTDDEPAPLSSSTPGLPASSAGEGQASLSLDPLDWHDWPIVSPVPENARRIYLRGQDLGRDAHAFSVFGDCQSVPTLFLGGYESNPALYEALPPDLQATVDWFRGSFNRASPTVRAGTTTGALLWSLWHQNKFTCTSFESPLQCELRIHNPAFVIIQVGTHYEDRNEDYMRTILDQLIAAGVVPILATKADDFELDEHVNTQYARLAVEYDIPFWNFWAAVGDLPDRGLYTQSGEPEMGNIYLTSAAMAIHNLTALQVLDAVRRAVTGP